MRDRKVAVRYAGALLASARQAGVLEGVADSFAAVVAVVKANRDLAIFLGSPQVAEQEKKDLLNKVFGGKVEDLLLTFFELLIDKNRIESLQDIGEAFAELVELEQGVVRARVITAIPLPDDLAAGLKARLDELTGKSVILEQKVDAAVIGGVCVTLDGKIIDGTVRANLRKLREQLEKAPVR